MNHSRPLGLVAVVGFALLTACTAGETVALQVQPVNHLQLESLGGRPVTIGVGDAPLVAVLDDTILLEVRGSSSCPPVIERAEIVEQQLQVRLDREREGPCTDDAVPYTFRLIPTTFSGYYGEIATDTVLQNAADRGVLLTPRRGEPFPINLLRRVNTRLMHPADRIFEVPTLVGG